jgi:hypothetical protein
MVTTATYETLSASDHGAQLRQSRHRIDDRHHDRTVRFLHLWRRGRLILGKLYFPNQDPFTATLAAFVTYFIGFVGRPIDAAIFSHYGDRILYFATVDTAIPSPVFVAIVPTLIPHNMQYAPQAALIAEAFTPRLRYSGSSLGYQQASVIAGGSRDIRQVFMRDVLPTTLVALFVACSLLRLLHLLHRGRLDARLVVDREALVDARIQRLLRVVGHRRLLRPVTPGLVGRRAGDRIAFVTMLIAGAIFMTLWGSY